MPASVTAVMAALTTAGMDALLHWLGSLRLREPAAVRALGLTVASVPLYSPPHRSISPPVLARHA